MIYQNGEITVTPYTIYWMFIPPLIGEPDKIELLKRDILIIGCSYSMDEYTKLNDKKDDTTAFFFNLDKILSGVKPGGEYERAVGLAKFIAAFCPDKSIIHTSTIDEKLKHIFRSEGLIYIEKNFNDKDGAYNAIMSLVKPIFSSENQVRRTYVRIGLYPASTNRVEVTCNNGRTVVNGYLKDVSINGLGIIFTEDPNWDVLSLKEQVQLRIFTQSSILKVPIALVTRKNKDNKEYGLSYNINDRNMIREESANYFMKIIYKWIKDVIDKYVNLAGN